MRLFCCIIRVSEDSRNGDCMLPGDIIDFRSKLFYERDDIARNGQYEVRVIRMKRIDVDSTHVYEGELIRVLRHDISTIDAPIPFDDLGGGIEHRGECI